jgi:hypothetical protein
MRLSIEDAPACGMVSIERSFELAAIERGAFGCVFDQFETGPYRAAACERLRGCDQDSL